MLRNVSGHLALVLLALAVTTSCAPAPVDAGDFPRRVLLTNDNGIEDTALIELARAFAREPGIEVTVVAATRDRSGTSNYLGAMGTGQFRVERRDLGPDIEAWALDGYPADCVIFALTGPLRERLPDVVVSGINGGPNMADDWFGSGTIGAARTAAYFGIPAVAVSGLEDDHAGAVEAATSWVVRFVQSSIVAALVAPQYLTVSLPAGTPPEISGVRIVQRARGLMDGSSRRVGGNTDADSTQVWLLEIATHVERAAAGTDVPTVAAGFIAIVPMRVDEYDAALAARLLDERSMIPGWIAPEAAGSADLFACDARLGIMFDDAEDTTGREWGVLLEEVSPTGLAYRLGLRAGDVITTLNATPLESQRGDPEDPDDRFLRMLRALPCESTVVVEYVRNGVSHSVSFAWEAVAGP